MVPSMPTVLTDPVTDSSDLITIVPVPVAEVVTAGTSSAPLSLSDISAEYAGLIAVTSSAAPRAKPQSSRGERNVVIEVTPQRQQSGNQESTARRAWKPRSRRGAPHRRRSRCSTRCQNQKSCANSDPPDTACATPDRVFRYRGDWDDLRKNPSRIVFTTCGG